MGSKASQSGAEASSDSEDSAVGDSSVGEIVASLEYETFAMVPEKLPALRTVMKGAGRETGGSKPDELKILVLDRVARSSSIFLQRWVANVTDRWTNWR